MVNRWLLLLYRSVWSVLDTPLSAWGSLLLCDTRNLGSLEGLSGLDMSTKNEERWAVQGLAGGLARGRASQSRLCSLSPACNILETWRAGRGGTRVEQGMQKEENRSEASSPGRTPVSHTSGQPAAPLVSQSHTGK